MTIYENGVGKVVRPGFGRYLDVLRKGVAREAKTGWVRYNTRIVNQIRKDWLLIQAGKIDSAHWHFMPSGRRNTVGADPRILDLLESYGIGFTIHMPMP